MIATSAQGVHIEWEIKEDGSVVYTLMDGKATMGTIVSSHSLQEGKRIARYQGGRLAADERHEFYRVAILNGNVGAVTAIVLAFGLSVVQ